MAKQLFQAIQFSTIWPIDRILSGATTPGQSRPRSDGNEGVLHIHQSSSIIGTWQTDCLAVYQRHLLGEGVLSLCRKAVDVFYGHSQLEVENDYYNIIFCQSFSNGTNLVWKTSFEMIPLGIM